MTSYGKKLSKDTSMRRIQHIVPEWKVFELKINVVSSSFNF